MSPLPPELTCLLSVICVFFSKTTGAVLGHSERTWASKIRKYDNMAACHTARDVWEWDQVVTPSCDFLTALGAKAPANFLPVSIFSPAINHLCAHTQTHTYTHTRAHTQTCFLSLKVLQILLLHDFLGSIFQVVGTSAGNGWLSAEILRFPPFVSHVMTSLWSLFLPPSGWHQPGDSSRVWESEKPASVTPRWAQIQIREQL